MDVDVAGIIEYGIYAVTGIGGWFVKLLWGGQRKLEKEMEALKLDVATNYTRKDDFKEIIGEFKREIKESITDLGTKVNKIDDYIREKH